MHVNGVFGILGIRIWRFGFIQGFPFENHLQIFLKMGRKSERLLAYIIKRLTEKEIAEKDKLLENDFNCNDDNFDG